MYSIRGVTLNAGQQRNFFLNGSLGDTYNVDRIDFGRGPNAVLFNVVPIAFLEEVSARK